MFTSYAGLFRFKPRDIGESSLQVQAPSTLTPPLMNAQQQADTFCSHGCYTGLATRSTTWLPVVTIAFHIGMFLFEHDDI